MNEQKNKKFSQMVLEYQDLSSIYISYWSLKNKTSYHPKPGATKKYYYNFGLLIDNEHVLLLSAELSKLVNWNCQDQVYMIVAVNAKSDRRLITQSNEELNLRVGYEKREILAD